MTGFQNEILNIYRNLILLTFPINQFDIYLLKIVDYKNLCIICVQIDLECSVHLLVHELEMKYLSSRH